MQIPKSTFIKPIILALVVWLSPSFVFAEPLLNGVAIHSELGQEQFVAGLFSSTLSTNAATILSNQEEKALEVRVLADRLSTRRFKRMWIEGMAINASPTELEDQAKNMAQFSNLVRVKLKQGDIFAVKRGMDVVSVEINGAKLGEIEDPKFFDLLLRTWIGPVPLSSDFRTDLLSEGVIKPGPLARFEQTTPSTERREALVAALGGAGAATAAEAASTTSAAATSSVASTSDLTVPKPSLPKADTKISLAPPKISIEPTATPTPTPTAVQQAKKTPTATPTPAPKVATAPKQQDLDESIFDEEDDFEFTAESLLKEQLYYTQLAKYTHKFLQYPQRAWDRGREGNIRLRVTINRKGDVINTELLEEARYRSLNNEAKDAVKRASPYPEMPEEVAGDEYSFTFRVAFKIVNQ